MKFEFTKHTVDINKLNLISTGTKIDGQIEFYEDARFEASFNGKLIAHPGTKIILAKNAEVVGDIIADAIIVDGFVRGTIKAKKMIHITSYGKVIGDIDAPTIQIDFGAFFDGTAKQSSL